MPACSSTNNTVWPANPNGFIILRHHLCNRTNPRNRNAAQHEYHSVGATLLQYKSLNTLDHSSTVEHNAKHWATKINADKIEDRNWVYSIFIKCLLLSMLKSYIVIRLVSYQKMANSAEELSGKEFDSKVCRIEVLQWHPLQGKTANDMEESACAYDWDTGNMVEFRWRWIINKAGPDKGNKHLCLSLQTILSKPRYNFFSCSVPPSPFMHK